MPVNTVTNPNASPYTIDPNADYNQQISKLLSSEPQNQQDYLQNLRNQYNYQDRMNRLQGIQKNVANTDQMLQNLPQQLQQRTSGRLMTQGQLDRLTSTETAPLAKTLAQLSSSQNTEQTGLNDINSMINQAVAQRSQNVSNIYNELNTLRQNKIAADAAEAQRRFQAQQQAISNAQARANLDYQNQLEMKKAQALADLNKAPAANTNVYVDVPSPMYGTVKNNKVQATAMPNTETNQREADTQGYSHVWNTNQGDAVYKKPDGTYVVLTGQYQPI